MKSIATTLCLLLLLTIGLVGCKKPVAEWGESDIESWIKKEWKLAEVTVTDNEDGTFSASGKNETGIPFTFRIEKKPDVKELNCVRLSGDDATPDGKAIKDY